jgi:hypothetical protein
MGRFAALAFALIVPPNYNIGLMSQLIGWSIAQAFKIPRPPIAGFGTFSLANPSAGLYRLTLVADVLATSTTPPPFRSAA